jgi:hypothetical protein
MTRGGPVFAQIAIPSDSRFRTILLLICRMTLFEEPMNA